MVFKFYINGTVRANSVEDGIKKIKDEFGEEFFDKHVSLGSVEEDSGQEVDVR